MARWSWVRVRSAGRVRNVAPNTQNMSFLAFSSGHFCVFASTLSSVSPLFCCSAGSLSCCFPSCSDFSVFFFFFSLFSFLVSFSPSSLQALSPKRSAAEHSLTAMSCHPQANSGSHCSHNLLPSIILFAFPHFLILGSVLLLLLLFFVLLRTVL